MSQIPDFASRDTLKARYKRPVELQRDDIGLRRYPANREQSGAGKRYCDDLLDCLIGSLRVQNDHELQCNKVKQYDQ